MDIRLLSREEIDKVKWNSCVHYAVNGNIFGYMWYLDHVAKDWVGLVEGDYESVFPLVWRKSFFKGKELYQPSWMRELGIYSIHVLSPPRIRAFLEAIPEEYKQVDIQLNEQNLPPEDCGFMISEHINQQLLLSKSYEELADVFSRELLLKLEKSGEHNLIPSSGMKPEQLSDFYIKYGKGSGREQLSFPLLRIMYNALHRGWGFISGVMNDQQEMLAADFLIFSHGKVVSLSPIVSPKGREMHAQEYMINMLLRSYAGRPLLFDFNQKESGGLAQEFGAQPNSYYRITRKAGWFSGILSRMG